MTTCCLCHARGLARSAKPVQVGVPLCVECRDASDARVKAAGGAAVGVLDMGGDSRAVMARYGARLTLAQAPMRDLAAMPVAGSA